MPATKISSGSTFAYKRVFPIFWFGGLVVFVGLSLTAAISRGFEPDQLLFLIFPVFIAIVGFTVMKKLVWDLVDEVYDHGDYLVIRNGGDEARIELSEIMNVSVSANMNPPRVTLRLVHPSRFGNEVSFSPTRPFTLNPFARNAIAESLIVRVDQARSQRRP